MATVGDGNGQSALMPDWENCLAAVLLIGVVPLAPLLFELLLKSNVNVDSLTITAAIYAVTIGLASRRLIIFIMCFVVAFFECGLYGYDVSATPSNNLVSSDFLGLTVAGSNTSPYSHAGLILLAVIVLFATLVTERAFRHFGRHEIFFEFLKPREETS